MNESIHGHEVLHMLADAGHAWSREDILAAIRERFGAEARFHTCAAQGLSPEGLLAFLESRGKFVPQDDGVQVDESSICDHE